ncbi:MAG: hypothetical protein ACYC55_01105 [Candidatus Geothermincolia bacterium]
MKRCLKPVTTVLAASLLLAGTALAGCGEGEPPARRAMEAARTGNYMIRASGPYGEIGEAVWANGSYRVSLTGKTGVAFYDADSGEIWLGDSEARTLMAVDIHELAAFDWWLPALLVEDYEEEMRLGDDGLLVAQLDIGEAKMGTEGPDGLPSSFLLVSREVATIDITYAYGRLGEIREDEVAPPPDWARVEEEAL